MRALFAGRRLPAGRDGLAGGPGPEAYRRTAAVALPTDADTAVRVPSHAGVGGPRLLMAARDDRRALYLNTPGLWVGVKSERLVIRDKEKATDEVRLRDVNHLALFGNIQLSTQAVQQFCEMEIPMTYFSMGGWFYGLTHGHGLKNVFTRVEQFRCAADPAASLALAKQFIHGKIRNQRTLLMRNHLEPPDAPCCGSSRRRRTSSRRARRVSCSAWRARPPRCISRISAA